MRMKKIPLILMCGAACFSAVTGCAGSGDASKATPDSAIKGAALNAVQIGQYLIAHRKK